jgi:hypothetical protein
MPSRRSVAAALVVAVLLSACTPAGTDPVTPDSPAPSTAPVEPDSVAPTAAATAVVLMDGWSYAAATSNPAAVPLAVRDGQDYAVQFAALDGPQIAGLARDFPQTLELAIARMVEASTVVACDGDGCVLGDPADASDMCARGICVEPGHRVSLEELAAWSDATTIPSLGKVYAAWDVPALLYMATIPVSGTALTLAVGESVVELPLAVNSEPIDEDLPGWLRDAQMVQGGYGQDVFTVAYGLGHLFVPRTQWREEADSPYALDQVVQAPGSLETAGQYGGAPMSGAVGTRLEAAVLLGPGQLTYATSPSTGCAIGVICLPIAEIPGTVDVRDTTTVEVCDLTGAPTSAIVSDIVTTVELGDRPVHQAGMWDGASRADFPGKSGGYFSGQPILTTGTLRVRALPLYVEQSGGTLFDYSGSVWQLGVDPKSDAEGPFSPEAIMTESYWNAC